MAFGVVGQAAAETPPNTLASTRELKVTAVVPGHGDIVINTRGDILEITSNTLEDVPPQVYLNKNTPRNKKELTAELYKEYRKKVPEGTAEYGKLYEAGLPALLVLTASRR